MAAWSDWRWRRVPNQLLGTALVLAIFLALTGADRGEALLELLAGAGVGFGIFLPFYWRRVMGAGDIKLLMLVGALTGPPNALIVALLVALSGGGLALIYLVCLRLVPGPRQLPYALAIGAGTLEFVVLQRLFPLRTLAVLGGS